MTTGRTTGALGVAFAVAFSLARAEAAPGHDADDEDAIIHHALELRRSGNDRAALKELERAYEIAHSPRAAAQLGFAEQSLGMWPEAEGHVSEALRADDDPWVRKNHLVVSSSLSTIRSHVGLIQIIGGEPGAQVSLNGRAVGSIPLPQPVSVSAGPVDVEVRGAGYAPALKTVNVGVGEYARVPITLRPAPPPQPKAKPAPRTGPVAVATAPERPIQSVPAAPAPGGSTAVASAATAPPPLVTEPPPLLIEDTRQDYGRSRRVAGIALVAGGVAVVGGGVAASLFAKQKFDAINADAAADRPYDPGNGNWKSYETAATVLYAVGGAALIGGALLYLDGRAHRGEARSTTVGSVSLQPLLAPRRAGASLSVRF